MNVHVTAKDIAEGAPRVPASCPVALALRRAGVDWPYVTPGYMEGTFGLHTFFWRTTPDAVRDFVVAFDDGQPVEPFEFDLDIR